MRWRSRQGDRRCDVHREPNLAPLRSGSQATAERPGPSSPHPMSASAQGCSGLQALRKRLRVDCQELRADLEHRDFEAARLVWRPPGLWRAREPA
ncbi:hypothetical protein BDY17DRAFT_51635 [Neohortaea acidophila]|uniref:Uncharacterized protein n=1 Tax=Neohortaea acidophila TaxID=245834 RepID=A0A6A6PH10_9PEZI|nr:uncharacterized protein BDY17DRAFT_51635 [Neohortaea acidophila]KAF2479205.1 hypothetical protein BDY17DRAFT_51635 [Neohortaea acidophila]